LSTASSPVFSGSIKKPPQTGIRAEEKAGESVVPMREVQQIVMSIAGKDGKLAGNREVPL